MADNDKLNAAMATLTEALATLNSMEAGSREVSLAKTKIEEAQHWLLVAPSGR